MEALGVVAPGVAPASLRRSTLKGWGHAVFQALIVVTAGVQWQIPLVSSLVLLPVLVLYSRVVSFSLVVPATLLPLWGGYLLAFRPLFGSDFVQPAGWLVAACVSLCVAAGHVLVLLVGRMSVKRFWVPAARLGVVPVCWAGMQSLLALLNPYGTSLFFIHLYLSLSLSRPLYISLHRALSLLVSCVEIRALSCFPALIAAQHISLHLTSETIEPLSLLHAISSLLSHPPLFDFPLDLIIFSFLSYFFFVLFFISLGMLSICNALQAVFPDPLSTHRCPTFLFLFFL
jgi:hypothetical protein